MKLYKYKFLSIFLAWLFISSAYGARRSPTTLPEVTARGDSTLAELKEEPATENDKEEKELENNVFYADEWIRSWFVRIDRDGNNVINKSEFMENMQSFSIDNEQLSVFENGKDGALNLLEFQQWIDSTKLLTREDVGHSAATVSEDSGEVDTIKLMAGVLAISLLMAAFKYV